MVLAGVVPFLLYLSVVINLILVWFSVKCLTNVNNIQEDLEDLMNKTDVFTDHLEEIYELEMFYGDETLQAMLDHSKQLINEYIELQAKYFDVEIIEELQDDTNENKEEETASP
tara:strand:+ start:111 stop:452 length:342 start_codon:yes stop_codon:yes gene_type:complete